MDVFYQMGQISITECGSSRLGLIIVGATRQIDIWHPRRMEQAWGR